MRVFLAGATGVVGRPLVRDLVAAGFEVTALTRSSEAAERLRAAGVAPIVGDVFDRDRTIAAVRTARPEVVLHELTALPKRIDPRRVRRDLAATNRLRTEGTEILLAAAQAAGARRFVFQGLALVGRPGRAAPWEESEPPWIDAPGDVGAAITPLVAGERRVLEAALEGVVLRYGAFYGPGTVFAPDGSMHADVLARRVPIVGRGRGVTSFVHVDDAAAATVAAAGDASPGVYHVVDDDPTPVAEWLPAYAAALGAPRPLRVPRWLARFAAGAYGVFWMDDMRAVSNARAKRDLGWAPRRPSWRTPPLFDAGD